MKKGSEGKKGGSPSKEKGGAKLGLKRSATEPKEKSKSQKGAPLAGSKRLAAKPITKLAP